MSTLNDLDIAKPLSGSTIDELAAEVRNLKTIIKNVLLVAHNNDGTIDGTTVTALPSKPGSTPLVVTAAIGDAAVTAVELAADAVETAKIKNSAVTGAKLAAGALTAAHFNQMSADDCIPSAAFGNASIELKKLATQLTASELADNSVITRNIANGAVTNDKIANMAFSKLTGTASDNQVLTYTTALGWHAATPAALPTIGLALIMENAAGAGGNVTSANTWTKRTIVSPLDTGDIFNAINNGDMTFNPGTYFIYVRAPGHDVKGHQLRLRETPVSTGTPTTIALGSTAYTFTGSVNHVQSDSVLIHALTVTDVTTVYQIEHYLEVVAESDDLGADVNSGENNIHMSGYIFKLP